MSSSRKATMVLCVSRKPGAKAAKWNYGSGTANYAAGVFRTALELIATDALVAASGGKLTISKAVHSTDSF